MRRRDARPPSGPDVVGAVRLPQVLDGSRVENLDKPNAARDYWNYKTPLEVSLGRKTRTIVSTRGGRIIIGKLPKKSTSLPNRVIFVPCPSRVGGGPQIAAFAGGFAFSRPGCVTVSVRGGDRRPATRSYPFGVDAC